MSKEPLYIITAVNHLTGEREAVSRPHSRWKTEELLIRARRDHRRHRKQACYSLYRMERLKPQEADNTDPTPNPSPQGAGSYPPPVKSGRP